MHMSMVVENMLTNVNKYFQHVIISGLHNPLKQMLTGIVSVLQLNTFYASGNNIYVFGLFKI